VRRIGVLMPVDENDAAWKPSVSAFIQALAELGWTEGRNVRMDLRWAGGDINRIQALAQELVGPRPDIIVTDSTPATLALQRETRTIPIVFAGVGDPVANGLIERVNQPGGNITGFALFEPTLGGKPVQLPVKFEMAVNVRTAKALGLTIPPTLLAQASIRGLLTHLCHKPVGGGGRGRSQSSSRARPIPSPAASSRASTAIGSQCQERTSCAD
jgi:hypothetical protein